MEKWQEIFDELTAAGVDTYAPGGHIGPCGSPYCVVQSCGATLSQGRLRAGRCEYRIYLVVPIEQPSGIDKLAAKVMQAMQPLVESGALQLDTPRSAVLTDNSFSALISHIDYTCFYSERN